MPNHDVEHLGKVIDPQRQVAAILRHGVTPAFPFLKACCEDPGRWRETATR